MFWILLSIVFDPELFSTWFRVKLRHEPELLIAGGVTVGAALALAIKGERFSLAFIPMMSRHIRWFILRLYEFHEGKVFTFMRFTFLLSLLAWSIFLLVTSFPATFAQRGGYTPTERIAVLEQRIDGVEKSHDALVLARLPERMAVVEKLLGQAIERQEEAARIQWAILLAVVSFLAKELFTYVAHKKQVGESK